MILKINSQKMENLYGNFDEIIYFYFHFKCNLYNYLLIIN